MSEHRPPEVEAAAAAAQAVADELITASAGEPLFLDALEGNLEQPTSTPTTPQRGSPHPQSSEGRNEQRKENKGSDDDDDDNEKPSLPATVRMASAASLQTPPPSYAAALAATLEQPVAAPPTVWRKADGPRMRDMEQAQTGAAAQRDPSSEGDDAYISVDEGVCV